MNLNYDLQNMIDVQWVYPDRKNKKTKNLTRTMYEQKYATGLIQVFRHVSSLIKTRSLNAILAGTN